MQSHNLHTSFITQFNPEYVINACFEEQQEQNFYFTQFAGNENEITVIGLFIKEMTQSATIRELVIKLENQDGIGCQRLLGFVKKLLTIFSSFALDETYSAKYYKHLLGQLHSFLSVLTTFQQLVKQNIFNKVKAVFSNEANAIDPGSFSSMDVDNMQVIMEQYLDEARRYYNIFDYFLQNESNNNGKGVNVTSPVEQALTKLIMLIEELILATEATNSLLEEWKRQLESIEVQVVYN